VVVLESSHLYPLLATTVVRSRRKQTRVKPVSLELSRHQWDKKIRRQQAFMMCNRACQVPLAARKGKGKSAHGWARTAGRV